MLYKIGFFRYYKWHHMNECELLVEAIEKARKLYEELQYGDNGVPGIYDTEKQKIATLGYGTYKSNDLKWKFDPRLIKFYGEHKDA